MSREAESPCPQSHPRSLTVTQSISHLAPFPWAKQIHSTYRSLQKVCSSVYSIRLTQGEFDSHVCEALSWVPRQGMPGWMESTGAAKPGLGGREGGTKMQPANHCWVSILSWTAFKTKFTASSERIPLTIHLPSSLKYLQIVNLLTVWKLIIRQLIQLSSTGRINSIYLPVISNSSCFKRMKQNMID